MTNPITAYLLSLPERVLRSASALAGGLVKEIGHVTLPATLRQTRIYQTMVDTTLRFLIEQVGQVEGAYPAESKLAENFLLRRTAGNGLEIVGILAFRASPVWVMVALADLSGTGKHLIREISGALKQEGLIEPDLEFESVDQILDGLERTAGRTAEAINTPPLDVASLRQEWTDIRQEASRIPLPAMPSVESLTGLWRSLASEAAAQNRNVFEVSAAIALSTAAKLPENVWWLSRAARTAATTTGQVFADAVLTHYAEAIDEIRREGFFGYWSRQFRPYLSAAARQFTPGTGTLTGRLLGE